MLKWLLSFKEKLREEGKLREEKFLDKEQEENLEKFASLMRELGKDNLICECCGSSDWLIGNTVEIQLAYNCDKCYKQYRVRCKKCGNIKYFGLRGK